ncbi:TrlF family AAA-like ATPase [Alicyclobacillus tolerans]|uniref:TrlF family AAA-like ATPase n=1 Tax=Alicyclobacillus tolerans TaxID=90970 RepID=UPI003B7D54D9
MRDNGAHFHRCDFQVHSPRDINWNGTRAVTESERKSYAEDFIRHCIDTGLHAVAITDHHDVVFFQYIKEAALEAEQTDGVLVTVFPGVEVSIARPSAQLLLLFDPDIDITAYRSVLPKLGITPSLDSEAQTCAITQLDLSVQDIVSRLNETPELVERYIVLPNVKPDGHKTFMRRGNHTIFSKLPCVGGYVEGVTYESIRASDRRILEGKIPEWSSRAYGVFQTSDARDADFSELGRFSTWVKWTRPSTEAIRQACLSQDCRISHDTPSLPKVHIDGIEVSASRFLGPVDVKMNPQFNALIGGRGTGKSSLLEYIRWGLCDQPVEFETDLPTFEKKRTDLVKNTLENVGGVVTVRWSINGVPHAVVRSTVDHSIQLSIADSTPRLATADEVRSLLPIQAYSQKQLSTVGVNVQELRRFIELPIQEKLRSLKDKFEGTSTGVRQDLVADREYKRYLRSLSEHRSSLASLREQSKALREQMVDLSPEDQQTLKLHQQFMQDRTFVEKVYAYVNRVREQQRLLLEVCEEVDGLEPMAPSGSSNEVLIRLAIQQVGKKVLDFKEKLSTINSLSMPDPDWQETLATIKDSCDEHDVKYQSALARNKAYHETLKQLSDIEDRIVQTESLIETTEDKLKALGNPSEDLKRKLYDLKQIYAEERELYQHQCASLTALSGGQIEAALAPVADMSDLSTFIRETFQGANITSEKINSLCNILLESEDPFAKWLSVLAELRTVCELTSENIESHDLPDLENLRGVFIETEIRRLALRLDLDKYSSLLLYRLKQKPIFKYRVPGGEAIDFTDASAGQQASALLGVLLSIEGPPLIIDQPEDDLDNAVISQIANKIWDAKRKRQLIFSSHNANLVVNGDAELVVQFGYSNSADHSKGTVLSEGSIDVPVVKDAITTVMEGGDSAFKLRQEKYGF